MAVKWTTRRPPLRLYGSWDGDNLAELQEAPGPRLVSYNLTAD